MTPVDTAELLARSRAGDRDAFDLLYARLYDDLRRAAHRQLAAQRRRETLDTTALVHEAYVRLVGEQTAAWASRSHFVAVAARAMRRVIVDYVREWTARKRGGGTPPVTLSPELTGSEDRPETVIAVDAALTGLERFNERLARVAECRLFAGLTEAETAGALGVSVRTVQRDWRRARTWLQEELSD